MHTVIDFYRVVMILGRIFRFGAISTTAGNVLALLGSRANASTIARETRTAALGLTLIILKHKEGIRARLELISYKFLIRRSVAPG
jgi:hypothetical protein